MIERMERTFYPENEEEERTISNLLLRVRNMKGHLTSSILGEGDYHYISAIFDMPVYNDDEVKELVTMSENEGKVN